MSKIAIIDNGINIGNLPPGRVVKQVNFVEPVLQENHGTICASIINKYAPSASLIDLRIMNGNAGDARNLLLALQWCLKADIDIVSISCGTEKVLDSWIMQLLIRKLLQKNIIVVAAGVNSSKKSFPAELYGVIGVKTKPWLDGEGFYAVGVTCFSKGINIIASSQHECRLLKTPICNSYAAPYVTACISRYLDEYCDVSISKFEYLNKRLLSDSISL